MTHYTPAFQVNANLPSNGLPSKKELGGQYFNNWEDTYNNDRVATATKDQQNRGVFERRISGLQFADPSCSTPSGNQTIPHWQHEYPGLYATPAQGPNACNIETNTRLTREYTRTRNGCKQHVAPRLFGMLPDFKAGGDPAVEGTFRLADKGISGPPCTFDMKESQFEHSFVPQLPYIKSFHDEGRYSVGPFEHRTGTSTRRTNRLVTCGIQAWK